MATSASPWINPLALQKYSIAAEKYKAMGSTDAVTKAAETAGQLVVKQAQSLIQSQPDLQMYAGVSKQLSVWSDDEGVYVGIPDSSSLSSQAGAMDTSFPVLDTAITMVGSKLEKSFEQALLVTGKATNSTPSAMQTPISAAQTEAFGGTNEPV